MKYQQPLDSPWSDDCDDRILETLGLTDHEMAGQQDLEQVLAFAAYTLVRNSVDLSDTAAVVSQWNFVQKVLSQLKGRLAVALPSTFPPRFVEAIVLAAGDAEFREAVGRPAR
jgi:hypothetical protein